MLNPQEGGRIDAKSMAADLMQNPQEGMAAGASAQHCTGMTNWPNTIQCLG